MKINFLKSELAKGTGIALIFKIIYVVSGYLFYFLVAQKWGSASIGRFAAAWSLVVVLSVFAKFGFDSIIVKYIAIWNNIKQKKKIRIFYWYALSFVFVLSVAFSVFVFVFADSISRFLIDSDEYDFIIRFMSVFLFLFTITGFNGEALKGWKNITQYSVFQPGSVLTMSIPIFFIFLYFGNNEITIYYSVLISLIILFFLSFYFVFKNFDYRIVPIIHKNPFYKTGHFLKSGSAMFVSGSIFVLLSQTDIIILGYFVPNSEVGLYAIALKITYVATIVITSVNAIATPKFAEINKDNKSALKKIVKQTTRLTFGLSSPIIIITIIFGTEILSLFGAQFTQAYGVLSILLLGQAVNSFSGSVIPLLNMTGYERTARNIMILAFFLNIILNIILIPIYGIYGAAVANISTIVFWNTALVFYIKRRFGFFSYPL